VGKGLQSGRNTRVEHRRAAIKAASEVKIWVKKGKKRRFNQLLEEKWTALHLFTREVWEKKGSKKKKAKRDPVLSVGGLRG